MDSTFEYPQFLNLEEALPDEHLFDTPTHPLSLPSQPLPSQQQQPVSQPLQQQQQQQQQQQPQQPSTQSFPATFADYVPPLTSADHKLGYDPFSPYLPTAAGYLQYLQSCSQLNQISRDLDLTSMLNYFCPPLNPTDTTPFNSFFLSDPSWLCEPPLSDQASLSRHLLDHQDNNNTHNNHSPPVEPAGMSRAYVSLSDVNAFVAKADSAKQSAMQQLPLPPSPTSFLLHDSDAFYTSSHTNAVPGFADNTSAAAAFPPGMIRTSKRSMSLSSLSNADSDSLDEDSDAEVLCTPPLTWSSSLHQLQPSSPISSSPLSSKPSRLVIKIKNPHTNSSKKSYSLPNLASPKKFRVTKKDRRGSSQARLGGQSVRSDSISSFLARQHLSDAEEEEGDDDEEDEDGDDLMAEPDDDDDEYQVRQSSGGTTPAKKGRNVDKACNHCKRSHLRCDDMRPCRRCVATGKTGCKDVQHKPRGRPKLHKK